MQKTVFILVILIIFMSSCNSKPSEPSEAFVFYYNKIADILMDNKDQPEKTGKILKDFLNKNLEAYNMAASHVNTLDHEGKKQFVIKHLEGVNAAMDKVWNSFEAYMDNDQVNSLMDQLTPFDAMVYDKVWKEVESEKK